MKTVKMVLCNKCQEKIEKRAKVCPHCNAKRTNPKLAVVLISLGLFWMISDGLTASNTIETASSEGVAYEIGKVIKTDDFEILISRIRIRQQVGTSFLISKAPAGAQYITVEYRYKNISDEPISSWGVPTFSLYDFNDTEYQGDIGAGMSLNTELDITEKSIGDLNPGISVKGSAVYEVAKDLYKQGNWKIVIDADKKLAVQIN